MSFLARPAGGDAATTRCRDRLGGALLQRNKDQGSELNGDTQEFRVGFQNLVSVLRFQGS